MSSEQPFANAPESVADAEVSEAPHPGSKRMPPWNKGELWDAPRFTWRNWIFLLGPALLSGGSAIGGGEWLMGPAVTAALRRVDHVAGHALDPRPGRL